ncbi:MAG: hypothetical protein KGV44_08155 [Flavobacteriaceae bacterium]|nr:hypothetical protein [Flavobacteriaceae bacterium]
MEIVMVATVFYGIFRIFKEFLDFFLKKKIINSGHIEKADILGSPSLLNTEKQKYPSLKWGLICLFAGIGTLVITWLYNNYHFKVESQNYDARGFLFLGIELVSISLGFLIYFLIVMKSKK